MCGKLLLPIPFHVHIYCVSFSFYSGIDEFFIGKYLTGFLIPYCIVEYPVCEILVGGILNVRDSVSFSIHHILSKI